MFYHGSLQKTIVALVFYEFLYVFLLSVFRALRFELSTGGVASAIAFFIELVQRIGDSRQQCKSLFSLNYSPRKVCICDLYVLYL